MLSPGTGRYFKRGLLLLVMVALVTPLSWKVGELYAQRKAEAARQSSFEESRRLMEEQRDYLRMGTVFPDFPLVNAKDSSVSSLHEQLRGGRMMVFISPDCPSCDAILATIQKGLGEAAAARRICFVSDSPIENLQAWRARHNNTLACFQDRDRFIGSNYEFTVIPFAVVVNDRLEIVDFNTGGWTEADYARLLSQK